jgi:hypothetical protein
MRVSQAKTTQRVEQNLYETSKHIKSYGANNAYPQKILEIVSASGTGTNCLETYVKFIIGKGFIDDILANTIINTRKEKVNTLLRKCVRDYKMFNGLALLVKYNGIGEAIEYYNIPFEHCRIEINGEKKYTGRIAVHPDWTGIKGLPFKQEDIKYINAYNPLNVINEMTACGGPQNYIGQVLYFTNDGDFEYPICPFDSIVTDMLTEESVSTVKHRNAKNNFLPSGVLVRKGIKPIRLDDGRIDLSAPQNKENDDSAEELKRLQGDNNACKIWVVDIDADEEKPEFIPFDAKNYDRQYEYTEKTVQDNIRKAFNIHPVLIGMDVGSGFGSQLITNAYEYMNGYTSGDRETISEVFKIIFADKFRDYSIKQLDYVSGSDAVNPSLLPDLTRNERRMIAGFPELSTEDDKTVLATVIGVGGTQALIAIVTDGILNLEQKVQLLIKLFSFTEEEANKIMGNAATGNKV